jgi:hypothetical protein
LPSTDIVSSSAAFDGGRHKNDQTSHFQPRTFGTVTLTRLTVIITERVYDYSSSTTDIQPQLLETTQLYVLYLLILIHYYCLYY